MNYDTRETFEADGRRSGIAGYVFVAAVLVAYGVALAIRWW